MEFKKVTKNNVLHRVGLKKRSKKKGLLYKYISLDVITVVPTKSDYGVCFVHNC